MEDENPNKKLKCVQCVPCCQWIQLPPCPVLSGLDGMFPDNNAFANVEDWIKPEEIPEQPEETPMIETNTLPLRDIITTNDKYEDEVDSWFSKHQPVPIPGCMDPSADNYNPGATVDDGSCTYTISGCMDPSADNYNPGATVDDGSCTYTIPGCMDPLAENYNPSATVDDGSCTYPPCIPYQPEILFQAEVLYEPASYQFDTRVTSMLEIPHDYLWGLEVSFPYNPFPRLFFIQATTVAVNAVTKPANLIFWAYRAGTAWNSIYTSLVISGPETPTPPNPDPVFFTTAHWNYLYGTKWRYLNQIPNYGIERYETGIPSDATQTYVESLDKVPMTGFKNGSVMGVSELTTNYNNTIHYKTQFTLDEAKVHAYMYYFKNTRYLPTSIQTATTGAEIHAQFTPWSAGDVTSFKAWASANETTPNIYYTGPETEYQPEIPYQAEVLGTCPPVSGCTDPLAENYNPSATVDDGSCEYAIQPKQFTPSVTKTASQSATEMMDTFTSISQDKQYIFRQDPLGHGHILPEYYDSATWDGIPFDPTGKTIPELCAFIRPNAESPLVVRGLKERFYEVNPFQDNSNPTAAEIDNWNIEVIRHFRALFGDSTPINLDARLHLEARLASERKFTTYWDTAYPLDCDGLTTKGGPCGPCWTGATPTDTAGGHCGAAFFTNQTDRDEAVASTPYNNNFVKYPELENYITRRSGAEGVSAIGAEVPWSLKLGAIIADWVCTEGTTGHPGPYLGGRTQFGSAWWFSPPNSLAYRGKFR